MDAFRDKVAVVTGGGSGIGRAVCTELGRRGARVVVADINASAASEVAAEITTRGGRAENRSVDVTNSEAVEALVAEVVAAHGRIDYMFNNAGIGIAGEERDVTLDDWQRVLAVNLWGVVHGVRAAYPRMLQQGCGHIVNTASVAGLSPATFQGSYTTSKYAVVGLSCALRAEAEAYGVRVSVVCPGIIDTPIVRNIETRGASMEHLQSVMVGNMTSPAVCARAILRGVEKNKPIIVVTGLAFAIWWLTRISPRAAIWFWRTAFLGQIRRAIAATPRRAS
ncbi:MAG TPA: SDR family NAD(P)-dependent oxidoreductase [Candidatus Kryptonia bacterium]|nr:SDR family NAD(P)-dependent oxidoreductase [Candidatus Kryptonia bacterium]